MVKDSKSYTDRNASLIIKEFEKWLKVGHFTFYALISLTHIVRKLIKTSPLCH